MPWAITGYLRGKPPLRGIKVFFSLFFFSFSTRSFVPGASPQGCEAPASWATRKKNELDFLSFPFWGREQRKGEKTMLRRVFESPFRAKQKKGTFFSSV
jgi:hypothetical protein